MPCRKTLPASYAIRLHSMCWGYHKAMSQTLATPGRMEIASVGEDCHCRGSDNIKLCTRQVSESPFA